ncbi:MAG: DUF4041 domain-containing protein [Clostridiaceae bacterium]|nr:DUF4041 domain-containing protein [Clostridiaceae bacterium]
MAITDIFKTKQFKSDIERLQAENAYLNTLITPEMKDALAIKRHIYDLQIEEQNATSNLEKTLSEIQKQQRTLDALLSDIRKKKEMAVILDDDILYQDFGLYTPLYNLMNSDAYKNKLAVVRQKQKDMIKNNTAVRFPTNYTFNGSLAQGKKMISDNVKQVLRSFNNECESIIDKVKFNNVEAIRKRIIKSYEDLNKLNSKMQISITPSYLDLKLQEMSLCYEYSLKKQEEKEEAKRIREEQREEQKLLREIEEARRTSEKERSHYTRALSTVNSQLENCSEQERELLLQRRIDIETHLHRIDEELKQIDYREANQKAGYVYIISNIGAFGENIYKIGMTRRLEPMDRIDELGDASVPFKFDVHAMIFSDDAPALEAALHRAFDDRKVNMVNTRREFFNVSLEEIEQVVKNNYDKTVEFTKTATAEQFRESEMIRLHNNLPTLTHRKPAVIPPEDPGISDSSFTNAQNLEKELLYTRWGTYEMPSPYRLDLTRGPRKDLKKI